MNRYASATSVSVERSRAEIETLLRKHGATGFAYAWQATNARIEFMMRDRHLRFELTLPNQTDPAFALTPGGRRTRRPEDQERAWEQSCRSSWRALLLIIKAKLEAIAIGVSIFEQEFLSFIVTKDNRTVGEIVIPQLTANASSRLMLTAGKPERVQ